MWDLDICSDIIFMKFQCFVICILKLLLFLISKVVCSKASRSWRHIPLLYRANLMSNHFGVVLSKVVYTLCLLSLWHTLVGWSCILRYVRRILLRDLRLLHISDLHLCRFPERFFELADRAGITDRVWACSMPPEEFLACESHGMINLRVLWTSMKDQMWFHYFVDAE